MMRSLEAAIQKQVLVNRFIGWFDDGSHDVKGAFASLFTSTQHAGVFYADSLKEKREFGNNYGVLEAVGNFCKC